MRWSMLFEWRDRRHRLRVVAEACSEASCLSAGLLRFGGLPRPSFYNVTKNYLGLANLTMMLNWDWKRAKVDEVVL